eukprot:371497_1
MFLFCNSLLVFQVMLNFNGCHSYHIVGQSKTWWDANEYCKNTYHTHLITITDSTMNLNIFSDIAVTSWIGYYDFYTEGQWKWIGYNKTTYTNWREGQPNNANGGQDCVYLNMVHQPYWDDAPCQNLAHFVCADLNDYPDYYTSINPTDEPTKAPTDEPTKLRSLEYIDGNVSCNDLHGNMGIEYDKGISACMEWCDYTNGCKVFNYFEDFKQINDSRCYIFDHYVMLLMIMNVSLP